MSELQYVFLSSFHLLNPKLENSTFVYKAQSTKEVATFMAIFSYEALSLKKVDICQKSLSFLRLE